MMKPWKNINLEYLRLQKEVALLSGLKLLKTDNEIHNGKILLVVPCLIGEFVAAVPAIYDFISRNKGKKVDLLVTDKLKDLAGRINGVNEVYTSDSVYGREKDSSAHVHPTGEYETVMVLRISPQAFKILNKISAGKLITPNSIMAKYGGHLAKNIVRRQKQKQWRTLNFEILGGQEREMAFDEMFKINPSEEAKVAALNCMDSRATNVVIHTGTNWVMKHWDCDNWVELLKRIRETGNFNFIFIGSREDEQDFEYISSRLNFPVRSVINKAGIFDTMLLMRKADYFIGIDSGPGNLAHLADLRSIVIFGPGPHMYLPFNRYDIALDKSKGRGVSQMFISSKKSLINSITVDEVMEAFRHLENGLPFSLAPTATTVVAPAKKKRALPAVVASFALAVIMMLFGLTTVKAHENPKQVVLNVYHHLYDNDHDLSQIKLKLSNFSQRLNRELKK